ncbi:MAG TPA: ABC-type transport auxiliary lipoprotein family protein [Candidatus Acidoferrales bacterium]|nr:ABC-type transport auxiliary lipoprotein family protein [Candidatus Acidoferrales bacterium]
MRRIPEIAAVCLLVVMAASCAATPPTRYYVLDAPQASPTGQGQIPVRLIVGRITGSHLYRDDRVVYGTSSVQLGTYEFERWSEPPVDLIQDELVAMLRNSGQYRAISRIGSAARGDYVVRGHLDALDEIDNKPGIAARFSLQLELFDPATGTVVWNSSYNHDEPVQGSGKKVAVADVVQALDRDVQQGLQQLTGGLGQYLAAHAPQQSASN